MGVKNMKLMRIEKIGDDWGGDNLLFTIFLDKELLNLEYIDDKLYVINKEQSLDFKWDYYTSYDNMDYNGIFLQTVYIDKENLYHSIENGEIRVDKEICDLIIGDCEEVIDKINNFRDEYRIEYQRILWNTISFENDIYEQYIDTNEVDNKELRGLELLSVQDINIKEFAKRQGYEWF